MTDCVYINMRLLVELFPNMNPMSVYRWNTAKAKRNRLPAPDVVLAGDVDLWTVSKIMEWSDRCGMGLDWDTVEARASEQFCQTDVIR